MSGSIGDNPYRASGVVATLSEGRTGTVDWITTPKVTGDSPITGVTAKGYFLNTTAGAITLNLPAGVAGSIISMADYGDTWQTNNVTVSPNGSEKIGGTNADVTLDTQGQSVTLVYVDSTQGWLNTMDSTSNVRGEAFVTATGGCITTVCTNYKVHEFTGPGTFCVSAQGSGSNTVDYLVVAGGGGAGKSWGGGGGGGGARMSPGTASGCYTASPLGASPAVALPVSVQGYPITVGGGGTSPGPSGSAGSGGKGDDSSFSSITSTGGGFGARCGCGGGPGGSGGGASGPGGSGGSGDTPDVTPNQGFDGGDAPGTAGGAGGGGAGAVGADAPLNTVARGGAGIQNNINGDPAPTSHFSGGGGNPTSPCGTGGDTNNNGTTNRGGGGGNDGGLGGSGVVMIRYKFQ